MPRRRRRRQGKESRPQPEVRWIDHHVRSERQASRAWIAGQSGDRTVSLRLYARAAAAEKQALLMLPDGRPSTYSRLAVSAASLYYKAMDYESCRGIISTATQYPSLESWATRQLNVLTHRLSG